MNEKQIRETLHYIIKNDPNSIKAFVAKEALQRNNLKGFFQSIKKRGCISGIISTLNYYPQTHSFFETYYDEIEKLRMMILPKTYLKQIMVLYGV
ncbi:hypothetical protein DS884_07390 [Tenacibaculum sp. E3R01]|uniref:DUF7222 domain-containing protein n=1 Tax=Tenacibaculum sp. E3R01 TaxID=2267227 RepID=UPI000DEA60FB|nr:hypothetical protein [Tenacibaculum sp. E3R01]RBW59550.1 hypothetical protein DS884_07390 [Tenacibaculum sp. E3R01]